MKPTQADLDKAREKLLSILAIELGIKGDFDLLEYISEGWIDCNDIYKAVAQLITDEREACAEVAEKIGTERHIKQRESTALNIASAIRKRGEGK